MPQPPRSHLSARERQLRSRLAKLVHEVPLLRATLNPRERVCGKPGCRCARGEKHRSLYLVSSLEGKPRQLFVPTDWEQDARQWVANYQEVKELLEEISALYWDRLSRRREG
jgi:hypothetical protein